MRYEEYKDSGVAWIGEIPSHWEVAAFKRRISINNGRDYKEFQDDEIYPVMGSGGCFAYCSRYMYDGEALLLGRKGTIDKPLYINGKFWTVDTMFYAIPNKDLDCKFAYYLAITFPFNLYSTSTALPSMTQTDLGNNPVAFPPLVEQLAIASYLDEKCGKINGAIDVQKKKIDLLNELKQTIITNAVTKGLKPDAQMKDSGVEWIGEVPTHWEVMKTSLAFLGIGSGTTPSTSRKEYYTEEDGLYWLQTGDLNDGEITDTSKKITSLAADECNLKFYPTDSVVIAMYGATIGKVGLLKISTSTNQACCVLPKSKRCIPAFAFYLFIGAKKQLLIDAMGGGQPNISQDIIKKLKVSIPPISEQRIIVDHIAVEVSKIDAQISKANRRIELLNELKQSIITEAVTGKIKVI